MKLPIWIDDVLTRFDNRTTPRSEAQIADALRDVRRSQGDLNEEDWEAFLAEHSAFFFQERPEEDSPWGTYFGPMSSYTREDGRKVLAPDIEELGAEVVEHWMGRTCRSS